MTNDTKKTYAEKLKFIFDFEKKEIDFEKLKNRSKNYISQCRAAVKHYYLSNGEYFHSDKLNEIYKNAKKSKKVKKDVLHLKPLILKLNAIKNKRYKIAMKLQLISGLRMCEICSLDLKNDIEYIENNRMIVTATGKGGKIRRIKTLSDEYVYNELKKVDKFYERSTMFSKCAKYNIDSHDMRRIFAQIIYYNTGNKELVRKLLGHEEMKTTLIYLKRDIDFDGTKWQIGGKG